MQDKMMDIHCHILPEIDDGATSWEVSLMMVKHAVEQGVGGIIATPHYIPGELEYPKEIVYEKVEMLQEKVNAAGLACTIYPGMELYLSARLISDLEQGKVIPLADSQYLLVEFPGRCMPANLINLLYEIRIRGFVPIVAHPERNGDILERPEMVNQLLEQQAFLQVNASSILGRNGKQAQKIAHEFVQQGIVSFVASDGHSMGTRAIHLEETVSVIKGLTNEGMLAKMYWENANRIVHQEELARGEQYFQERRANLFGLLKRAVGFK